MQYGVRYSLPILFPSKAASYSPAAEIYSRAPATVLPAAVRISFEKIGCLGSSVFSAAIHFPVQDSSILPVSKKCSPLTASSGAPFTSPSVRTATVHTYLVRGASATATGAARLSCAFHPVSAAASRFPVQRSTFSTTILAAVCFVPAASSTTQ